MYFIHVTAELNFKQSFLQSSVSHDLSEIILICWFAAQEIFPIHVENSRVACVFLEIFCYIVFWSIQYIIVLSKHLLTLHFEQ